ncbi:MAG TPA: hypothetical protein VFB16_15535 [Bauldia sp.]|nr:hypothetical protein [Bauldia sp.]
MGLAWVLILMPLTGDGMPTEVPYNFNDAASCGRVAEQLFPERAYRCVQRRVENQFALVGLAAKHAS